MATLFDSLNGLADVQSLVAGSVRESELLEYKTATVPFSDGGKSEIAKDVSAMANSGGGVIIYGVATEPTDKTKPSRIEPLHPTNIESFDRVVNSQIKPPIKGIRKKLIPADAPQIMLIEVAASEDPPHQNLYDKKYYRRSGTESLPMEHDLVALHFGRRIGPLLSVQFRSLKRPTQFSGEPSFSDESLLRVLIENSGRRVGRFVEVIFLFPDQEHVKISLKSGNMESIDRLYQRRQARQFTENVDVFHPLTAKSIIEIGLAISKTYIEEKGEDPFVVWKIFADAMAPRQGSISLRDLGWI